MKLKDPKNGDFFISNRPKRTDGRTGTILRDLGTSKKTGFKYYITLCAEQNCFSHIGQEEIVSLPESLPKGSRIPCKELLKFYDVPPGEPYPRHEDKKKRKAKKK